MFSNFTKNLTLKNDTDIEVAWLTYLLVFIASLFFLILSKQKFIEDALIFGISGSNLAFLSKELGFAGIVSVILISTIERFSRRRHEKAATILAEKINKNLFYAIYKRYIPNEVFLEIERTVMKSGVFRQNHEITYIIEDFKGDVHGVDCEKHVTCHAKSRYVLKNISSATITHPVRMLLERPIDIELEAMCKIQSVSVGGKRLDDDTVKKNTRQEENQVVFSLDVTILAGENLDIETNAILLKRKLDQEVWASQIPSDGIRITVYTPNKDIEVRAQANHSQKLIESDGSEGHKTWELRHGMFPFQSVTFWWSPRKPLACPIKNRAI